MTNQEMNQVISFILDNQDKIKIMNTNDKIKFIACNCNTNTQVSGCMLHFAEQQTETDD